MTQKLMPCPFCGGKAYFWEGICKRQYKISCEECGCTLPGRHDTFFRSLKQGFEIWNRRDGDLTTEQIEQALSNAIKDMKKEHTIGKITITGIDNT